MDRKAGERINEKKQTAKRGKTGFKNQRTDQGAYATENIVSRYFSEMTRPENALISERRLIELAQSLEAIQNEAKIRITTLLKKTSCLTDKKMRDEFIARFGNAPKNNQEAREAFAAELVASDELSTVFKILGLHEGERVVSEILCGNLRLVVSVARIFWNKRSKQIGLEDLIQVGNIGLLKAIARFDWHRGYKFSTYAVWWIRHAISREYADRCSLIRIPVHVHDAYARILVAARENGIDIDAHGVPAEFLAEKVGITVERLWRIIEVVRTAQRSLSLETPVGDNSDCLEDLIADDNVDIPGARLEEMAMNDDMYEAMQIVLSDIEREIIAKRFGLGEKAERTLEDIGKDYDLTRERIRQIQAAALRKLAKAMKKKAA